jgi:PIN domain nuclease of toxin-antitoxin system
MKYLLDTHTMIWAVADTAKLSLVVREILENPDHEILVSPVSFWEISLKCALGKLELNRVSPEDFPAACSAMEFDFFPLEAEVASTLHCLKALYHKDPFDRMLIWQALCAKVPILSKDTEITLYQSEGLKIIW